MDDRHPSSHDRLRILRGRLESGPLRLRAIVPERSGPAPFPAPLRRYGLGPILAAAILAAITWMALPQAAAAAQARRAGMEAPRWEQALRAAGVACVARERDGGLEVVVADPSLQNLDRLIGAPIERLDLAGCSRLAGDLSALTGMHLRALRLAGCARLESLDGIQGMPLEELDCSGCAALAGAPTALRGMPLKRLSFAGCGRLTALDGLQGMPLEELDLGGCAGLRGDLLALRGTHLAMLDLDGCARLTSLAGIDSLPLRRLRLTGCPRLEDRAALAALGDCAIEGDEPAGTAAAR